MSHLIHIEEVPGVSAPWGPYTPAIVDTRNGIVTFSGRIAPPTGNIQKSIEAQTVDLMNDFHRMLGHIGAGFDVVTETGVFIAGDDGNNAAADDAQFVAFNEVYGGYLDLWKADQGLPPGKYPTRKTIIPRLLKRAGVELDMRASLPLEWTDEVIGQNPVPVYTLDQVKEFVARQKTE